jgi:hypothetical protein
VLTSRHPVYTAANSGIGFLWYVCWQEIGRTNAGQTTSRGKDIVARNRKGLAPWQARWLTLHDELHLLEVLLGAMTPTAEYTSEYWDLSTAVITLGEDLRGVYAQQLALNGDDPSDRVYLAQRKRLTALQARAQTLTLAQDHGI